MSRLLLPGGMLVAVLAAAILVVMPGQALPRAEAQEGGIVGGNKPPATGGYGTFAFGGGSFAQLLAASECPEETAVFFYNKPGGGFAAYIPAAIDAVNAEMMALFPNDSIPAGTLFTGKCYSLHRVHAPIESVEVAIAESFPPQYFLHVTSGLPGGCAQFDRYEVARDLSVITVTIWNLEPVPGQPVFCTAIYGYVEHSIALGSDFQSGETYTVHVNDVTTTFVAQ